MEPDAGTNGIVAPGRVLAGAARRDPPGRVYLIADEVMSGFGRCGEWFALAASRRSRATGLMTLAKGLTGAHAPLGAVVMSAEVAQALEHTPIATGLTYSGHPLCCAAGSRQSRPTRTTGWWPARARSAVRCSRACSRCSDATRSSARCAAGTACSRCSNWSAIRATRAPLSPWDEMDPLLVRLLAEARAQGVCFAARGNLVLLAPPLVIAEPDLDRALGAARWSC
jgi:taurine--2-oxoglutarate transaminase